MQDGKAVAAYFTYFGSLLLLKLSDEKKIFPVTVESIFHNAHCLCLYISISWFIEHRTVVLEKTLEGGSLGQQGDQSSQS